MALVQDLWGRDPFTRIVAPYTGKHVGAESIPAEDVFEYRPRRCVNEGTTACLHNHPGDGGYGKPAAHGTWGVA